MASDDLTFTANEARVLNPALQSQHSCCGRLATMKSAKPSLLLVVLILLVGMGCVQVVLLVNSVRNNWADVLEPFAS